MTSDHNELNQQTAKIQWRELERHFARGVVLWVAPGQDLIKAAAAFLRDDAGIVQGWLDGGTVRKLSDEQARNYANEEAVLWAVVAAPWVLVQDLISESKP